MADAIPKWLPCACAPKNQALLVWGSGSYRFMKQDDAGQWRNMMGTPRSMPRYWLPLDALPPLPAEAGDG